MIEIRDALTSEFKMLTLIFSYRDMCCSMYQDIRSLQNWVGEEAEFELRFTAAVEGGGVVF